MVSRNDDLQLQINEKRGCVNAFSDASGSAPLEELNSLAINHLSTSCKCSDFFGYFQNYQITHPRLAHTLESRELSHWVDFFTRRQHMEDDSIHDSKSRRALALMVTTQFGGTATLSLWLHQFWLYQFRL